MTQPGAAELQAWLRAADWERLRRHFEQAPPAQAHEFETRALMAMALLPGREGARLAAADLRRGCTLEPGNVRMAANLMQALIDAGLLDEALKLTFDAMRQAPQVLPLAEKHAWALVAAGRWDEAARAATHAMALVAAGGVEPPPSLAGLDRELAVAWWRPIAIGGTQLRLPVAADRDFVARCFRTASFIDRYRRLQTADDAAVAAFVDRALHRPLLTRRIDWVVCRGGLPLGLACLADLDFEQGRGELLVGLLEPDARTPSGLQASLAVMRFAFEQLRLRKLLSYVYGDNPEAQANTLHLGLRQEGLLREHLHTPAGEVDLFVNGMLSREWYADDRLQRLVARWARGTT